MKTLLCILLLSMSAFSQGKSQRFQIYELKPVGGWATIVLLDGDTGKSWMLEMDTVYTVSGTGTYKSFSHYWEQVPFEKSFIHPANSKEYIFQPIEEKKK